MANQYQYVRLPDKTIGRFRADETDAQIRAKISSAFPDAYQSAASHAQAGFTTAQGSPLEQPGFLSRLAETTGVPTSKAQLQSMQPSLAEQIGGPAVTAGKQILEYGKNLYRGAVAPPSERESQQMKEHPYFGGPAEVGMNYLLNTVLAPVGGKGVNQAIDDIRTGQYRAGSGDILGTIINLMMLKGKDPNTVERLVAATNTMPEYARTALPDLRAEVIRSGRPSAIGAMFGGQKPLDALSDRINMAEKRLNQEWNSAVGPHVRTTGPLTANGKFPVVAALENLENKLGNTTAQDKAARSYIKDLKSRFQKPLTIGELDKQRIAANNRTRAYWKQNDAAQYGKAGADVGTAADVAIANAIRDSVYPFVDRLVGKPSGYFANLKQRVGALMNMSSDLKENMEATEKQSMKAIGSGGHLPKVRGVVGMHGLPHAYLSEPMAGSDPFKVANKAAGRAFPNPIRAGINNAYVYGYPTRQQGLSDERSRELINRLRGSQ